MTTGTLDDMRAEVERSGYFPGLVLHAVSTALGAEPVESWVVHHEATFDSEMEMRRHVSVLVLTPTRLMVHHTDDHPADDETPRAHATTSVEVVPLRTVDSVLLSTVVAEPAGYEPGATPAEATLTVGWGAVGNVELEPAACADENCEADHGYVGRITSADLTLRVSGVVEGEEAVNRLLAFSTALSAATSRPG